MLKLADLLPEVFGYTKDAKKQIKVSKSMEDEPDEEERDSGEEFDDAGDPKDGGSKYDPDGTQGPPKDDVPDGETEEEEEEEELQETFSSSQLNTLRKQYDGINKVDPSGDAYKKLIKMLDSLDQSKLKQLAGAKIKFISNLARNRVKK